MKALNRTSALSTLAVFAAIVGCGGSPPEAEAPVSGPVDAKGEMFGKAPMPIQSPLYSLLNAAQG